MTTREDIKERLTDYLSHRMTLSELIDWAEQTMTEGGFDDARPHELMQVLGRVAAADAEGFGLLWEDCQQMLHDLGYQVEVLVTKAA